jgi:hypothetical protein
MQDMEEMGSGLPAWLTTLSWPLSSAPPPSCLRPTGAGTARGAR